MTEVIGIKLEQMGKTSYVEADQVYAVDDFVVVKQGKGSFLGQVVVANTDVADEHLPSKMGNLLGLASDMDLKAYQENIAYAQESVEDVKELIALNRLKMKLVDIVFPLDRNYVLITFSAEGRVDFRQLLKALASYFRTRIELRQINDREEAKIYGGLGPCGRALCCSSFLGEFPPVSIKMAKNQGLSLNSGKTSGICGRLMCCLSFEDNFYKESREKFPDVGTKVTTDKGVGVVSGIDVLSETVKVRFDEDVRTQLTYALEEVSVYG